MAWKWHSAEEIGDLLARVNRLVERGAQVRDAVQEVGISQATYFRWRSQYGGYSRRQLSVVKELQLENRRLRRILLELDATDLRDALGSRDARSAEEKHSRPIDNSRPRTPSGVILRA